MSDDALAYIDKAIDNVEDIPSSIWRSDEVIEMLRELRGMVVSEIDRLTQLADGRGALGLHAIFVAEAIGDAAVLAARDEYLNQVRAEVLELVANELESTVEDGYDSTIEKHWRVGSWPTGKVYVAPEELLRSRAVEYREAAR